MRTHLEPRGRIEQLRVTSRLLAGNPMGDPAERDLWVWLPPGYDREAERRYPVLYFLAGYTGTGRSFLNFSAWQENLPERLDRLVGTGLCPPHIAVMPDCLTLLGGSQYVDSLALGPYESHLADELVPEVDARYRTLGAPGRAILGKSSGGIGALGLAMRRPGLFAAAASHSGDCAFELSLAQAFPGAAVALERKGGVLSVLARLREGIAPDGRDIELLNTLCCAAAYSPQPAPEPWGFSLPFEEGTGATREAVFERWRSFDPVRAAARHREALAGLRLLYLDAGRSDEYHLQLGARLLGRELDRLGIAHRREEFEGGHRNTAHRYDVSVPAVCQALAGVL
ncbi:MAG: alpha/beta hydrolase [Deltaproteobacteria bacterium]